MTKQNEKDAKRVPELRFKGFTDDWEQVELNDIAPVTMGQSPNSKNYTENPNNYILVQGNADLFNGQVLPRIYTTQVTKVAHVGDILMSVRAPVGNIAQTQYDVVIGRGVAAISGNLFIKQLLNKMDKAGYWNKYIAGSTFESVNSNDIKSANIKVPKLEEQKKIGQLFQSLDKTITLHEEKQRQLEQLKKALLQKMFADETGYPVLRFKGFTEKWEQVKLSKTSRSYSGGTPKVGVHEYYDGRIPFIRSGEIASKSTELTISKVGLNNSSAKLVSKGDILYALYGATSGEVSLSKINGAINQAILAIKPIDGYENYFLMTWLQKEKEQITRTYLQGGQGNLSAKIVMNLVVNIPSLSEQSQIAQIFSKLDKTITLHDKKIQYLKQLKRGLLQKMFV